MSMSLRKLLTEKVKRAGVRWDVVERDYLLGWILLGISKETTLRQVAVFKGGTALKKCYFGDYRFSEDLDFTILKLESASKLLSCVESACKITEEALNHFAPITLLVEPYTEKQPHPKGQLAFNIRAQFPWQNQAQTRVLLETTTGEELLFPIQKRPIFHGYEEPTLGQIDAYSLEEVIAEKLRAILQSVEANKNRKWSRSRARDYYDIWRILSEYSKSITFDGFGEKVRKKCELSGVAYSGVNDFFEPSVIQFIESTWQEWLGPLVPNLPEFRLVRDALRPQLEEIL